MWKRKPSIIKENNNDVMMYCNKENIELLKIINEGLIKKSSNYLKLIIIVWRLCWYGYKVWYIFHTLLFNCIIMLHSVNLQTK